MAVVPLPEVEVALPLEDSVSAEAVTLVLVKSISSIWFLTGTISFELGVTIISENELQDMVFPKKTLF